MSRRPARTGLIPLLKRRPRDQASRERFVGAPGAPGADGRDAGLAYSFDTSTTMADPGAGDIRFNNATIGSVTELAISDTDDEANDLDAVLDQLDDSTSTIRAQIEIHSEDGQVVRFNVNGAITDEGAWHRVPVAHVSGTLFSADEALKVLLIRTGDKGDTGATGATGSTGATGPAGSSAPAARLATAAALPAHTRSTNTLTASANGALTVDGVAVAVNDLILVKDEGSGSHLENGLYTVTAAGSAGAAWVLDRSTLMDTDAEAVPGMLVTVAEGDKNKDTVWQLTTNATITLNTTALVFAKPYARDHGLVTALPANPVHGDLCTYTDSTSSPTYRFRLQYNVLSASSYKWEVIGGTPMVGRDDDSRTTTSTSYVTVPTDGMTLTLPLAGDWDITAEGTVESPVGGWTYYSYSVGGTAASDLWSLDGVTGVTAGSGNSWFPGSKTTRHTGRAASDAITEKIRVNTGTGGVHNRRLRAMPVRVG